MDREELYVLETCGKKWVWKKQNRASISNRLSIGKDGDCYSEGQPYDFAKVHSDILYNAASGSSSRKCQTECRLNDDMTLEQTFEILRTHKTNVGNPFACGSVGSTCMHFGGLVGDHTTASMVVELTDGKIVVWATGTTTPCVSLFKPWIFGDRSNKMISEKSRYWYSQEVFRRILLGKVIPEEYYTERNNLEKKWLDAFISEDLTVLDRCFEDEDVFINKWKRYEFQKADCAVGFKGR